ncbi:MAG TPA: LLM class F420-dependent oxidoreductase, partial [Deltaproteobacteria bacterium]|nr:LLM class F420-dependent oxidoreductase [Deltaproteobacteria bacterium]
MKIGLTIFATDRAMSPVELAPEAEARGFSSLYVPEHTHIPTSRRTPPPTGGTELADEYRRTLDPMVALAAAAAVTSRIRLGTAV